MMVQKIVHKEKKAVKIYFLGDLHLGSKTFAKKEFETTLKKIRKEKNSRIIMMGDHIDAIESDDSRRYDPFNIDKAWCNTVKQHNAILSYMKPLKHKIIGILTGNHERMYAKFHQDQFSKTIRDHAELLAHDLGVPYLEDMGIINLRIGKQKYNIVAVHGVGAGTTVGAQVTKLNKIINGFTEVPDVIAMGHVHALQTIVNPKMNFNFDVKIKHLGLTGNYYKTYIQGNINYGSSQLYNALPIGCIAYSFDTKGSIEDYKVII